jgi:hypothetical protein
MSLADLTSDDAVLRALSEFDALGRDRFLSKYGFRKARNYFLVRDGRIYDSKAIAGAAHGYQHPELGPLSPSEFSGGDVTVRARLEALGFKIAVNEPATGEPKALELFHDYSRAWPCAHVDDRSVFELKRAASRRRVCEARRAVRRAPARRTRAASVTARQARKASRIARTNVSDGRLLSPAIYNLFRTATGGTDIRSFVRHSRCRYAANCFFAGQSVSGCTAAQFV